MAASYLFPRHAGAPWCAEIMRITRLLDAPAIWAGKYTVKRVNGRSVRVNETEPSPTGARVLKQNEIARWPNSVGIEPPDVTCNYK